MTCVIALLRYCIIVLLRYWLVKHFKPVRILASGLGMKNAKFREALMKGQTVLYNLLQRLETRRLTAVNGSCVYTTLNELIWYFI